jgi:hypothetical protein
MAIYVYNISTGALTSWCPNDTDPVAATDVLAANGLAMVSGLPALGPTVAWDPVNKTTKTVTAPVVPQPILTGIWLMRFTPAEHQAIVASPDAQTQQIVHALDLTTQIDLTSSFIVNGVNYLVSINLLQSSRVAAIMAAPASVNGP